MRKLETKFVKYRDIDFLLEGKYYKEISGGYDIPHQPEEFEIHNVFIGDVNVSDILDNEQIKELEVLALER